MPGCAASSPTNDFNSDDFGKDVDPSRYMNDEQIEAWNGVQAQREGYIYQPYPDGQNSVNRGKVAIFERGGLVGANVLMHANDLGPK